MKRVAANNDADATDGDDHKLEGKRIKAGDDNQDQYDESNDNMSQPQESALAASLPQEMTAGASVFLGAAAATAVAAAGGPVGGESSELDGGGEATQQPSTAGGGDSEEGASSIRDCHRSARFLATADDSAAGGESPNKQAAAPASHTFDNMEDIDILEYSRDHSGSLTFPEKLMLMLLHIAKHHREMPDQAPTGFVENGFVVHNTDRLCNDWIPLFFRPCKFSSFRRKLFRWEFRLGAIVDESDMNLIPAASQEIAFCNENFKRDQKHLLSHMKSVTAEKTAEKEGLELLASGNDMSSDEQQATTTSISRSPNGRGGRLQKQQQTNRLVQGPSSQESAVGPGYGGGLYPYSPMLVPPPPGSASIHFRQHTLQHGPAATSFLHQQLLQQAPTTTHQEGMTTIPANGDPMARLWLAEAAAKSAAAGYRPGQLSLSLPELQELMDARGGQQPSQTTEQHQQQQHNADRKDQQPLQDCCGTGADNHDDTDKGEDPGGSCNFMEGEKQQQQHARQTTTMTQQHASHEEQLQNLMAWQSRQMSQLSGGGGGPGGAHPPPLNNGGGGSGCPDLMMNPHRTPQEEQRRRQLLPGASVPPQRQQQQQQHSAPYESGGGGGSHFALPGGNPW